MRPRLLTLAALPLLASCAGGSAPVRLSKSFRTGPIVVRPMAVIEDSRCPRGVQCIQAGRVVVKSRIDLPDSYTVVRDLVLGEPMELAGGWLTLAEVRPDARRNRTIDNQRYRFRFTYSTQQ